MKLFGKLKDKIRDKDKDKEKDDQARPQTLQQKPQKQPVIAQPNPAMRQTGAPPKKPTFTSFEDLMSGKGDEDDPFGSAKASRTGQTLRANRQGRAAVTGGAEAFGGPQATGQPQTAPTASNFMNDLRQSNDVYDDFDMMDDEDDEDMFTKQRDNFARQSGHLSIQRNAIVNPRGSGQLREKRSPVARVSRPIVEETKVEQSQNPIAGIEKVKVPVIPAKVTPPPVRPPPVNPPLTSGTMTSAVQKPPATTMQPVKPPSFPQVKPVTAPPVKPVMPPPNLQSKVQEQKEEQARKEKQAADAAKLKAEQEAAEAARIKAEKEAAEAARIKAEQEAAEAARLKAEQEAAEAVKLKAEQEAAEAARLKAEQEAAEALRLERENEQRIQAEQERLRLEAAAAAKAEAERQRLQKLAEEAEKQRIEQEQERLRQEQLAREKAADEAEKIRLAQEAAEAERLRIVEEEKRKAEAAERARLEQLRLEEEQRRQEAERAEQERIKYELAQKQAQDEAERQRLEALEKERLLKEEQDRLRKEEEARAAEALRLQQLAEEQEGLRQAEIRAEQERQRLEKLAQEQAEAERARLEQEKIENERIRQQELAKEAERQRLAEEAAKEAERKRQELIQAAISAEAERVRIEKERAEEAERQRIEAERKKAQEQARVAAEKEAARVAAEKEAARVAAEKEAARVAAEKEAAKIAAEQEAARLAEIEIQKQETEKQRLADQEKEKQEEEERFRQFEQQQSMFNRTSIRGSNRMSSRMSIKLSATEKAERDKAERDKLAEFTSQNPRRSVRQSIRLDASQSSMAGQPFKPSDDIVEENEEPDFFAQLTKEPSPLLQKSQNSTALISGLDESEEPDFFKKINAASKGPLQRAETKIDSTAVRQSMTLTVEEDDDHFRPSNFYRRGEGTVVHTTSNKPGRSKATAKEADYLKIMDITKKESPVVTDSFQQSSNFQEELLSSFNSKHSSRQGKVLPDNIMSDSQFVDLNASRRGDTRRNDTNRRQAVVRRESKQSKEQRIEAVDSSQSSCSDKCGYQSCEVDSDEIESYIKIPLLERKSHLRPVRKQPDIKLQGDFEDFESDIEKANLEIEKKIDEQEDFIKLLQTNENLYKEAAEYKLQDQRDKMLRSQNSLHGQVSKQSSQSVISEPQQKPNICRNFGNPKTVATCVAMNSELIFVGTSSGMLFAYNFETQVPLGVHKEDSKDFIDNAITCIDVHSRRQQYVVMGHAKGQMVIVDTNKFTKTVKCIKDHHKKSVVSVKFCDWCEEKPHLEQGSDHKCKKCEDIGKFMFMSCDEDGKVVQNTVTSVMFGAYYANDIVFVDPVKQVEEPIYQVMAPRMSSVKYPMEFEDDNVTLVAVGSDENVAIWLTPEKQKIKLKEYARPMRYPSQNMNEIVPIRAMLPILAWGFGKTPRYNFQTFPLLAIAWGPLIQLVVYKQFDGDPDQNEDFDMDGYYIIAPEQKTNQEVDIQIESLHFIDESLLVAVTSNQEIRVMLTSKFKEMQYDEPQHMSEEIKFDQIDVRCKMNEAGHELEPKQRDVELERQCVLEQPFLESMYGLPGSQTCAVHNDRVLCLTKEGAFYSMHHLHWLESLGNLEQAVKQGTWVKVFAKARKIYQNKITGFRIKDKDNMREALKDMINKQVLHMLDQWAIKQGANQQVREEAQGRIQTLIRVLIEFCVEVSQPAFLFDTLLKKFHQEGKSQHFAQELKPYILSGIFSEIPIQESILSEQILASFQKGYTDQFQLTLSGQKGSQVIDVISPAENFEKILLNLKLDQCSKDYKLSLIDYCKKYKLSSGLMYLCFSAYGEQGPVQALKHLKDFYVETKQSSQTNFPRESMHSLLKMPLAQFDRIQMEQSAQYLGLKLIWSTRCFLLGKKFPRGHFTTQEWQTLCHDILDFITTDEMIQLMTEIDAAAYFQVVSIVFNNPSYQFSYIEQGRPGNKKDQNEVVQAQPNPYMQQDQTPTQQQQISESISHELIVQRISTYFQEQQDKQSAHYLHYLCFIASVVGSYPTQDNDDMTRLQDENLYYEVLFQLLKNSEMFQQFNKGMLNRRMTNRLFYRRLSKQGITCQDDLKHLVLTERMLVQLVDKCKTILSEPKNLTELLKVVQETSYHEVQLQLYELDHNYLKCLKLFVKKNETKGFEDGFTWIQQVHQKLKVTAGRDQKDKNALKQLQGFEKEVLNQGLFLMSQDVQSTIKLFDSNFKNAHQDMLKSLKSDTAMQLYYVLELLDLKKEDIKTLFASSSGHMQSGRLSVHMGEHQKWTEILCTHVRLLCKHEPKSVPYEIKRIIKENFYPMEEVLKIVTEFNQIEAMALLNKKIGNYTNSISLYLQLLKDQLDYVELKKELYFLKEERKRHKELEREHLASQNKAIVLEQINANQEDFNSKKILGLLMQITVKTARELSKYESNPNLHKVWSEKFGKNIEMFDNITHRINSMCRKHPAELLYNDEIWVNTLSALFKIQFHPALLQKKYAKQYMKKKIVEFCRCIIPAISFKKILQQVTSMSAQLKLGSVRELIFDVFSDKSQEFEMCENAETNQVRDLMTLQRYVRAVNGEGITFYEQSLKCGLCLSELGDRGLVRKANWNYENKIFDCKKDGTTSEFNHTYHKRCLKNFLEADLDQSRINKKPHSDSDWERLLRCPICYPHSQDFVLQDTQHTTKLRTHSRNTSDISQSIEDSDSSRSSTRSAKSSDSSMQNLQSKESAAEAFQRKQEQEQVKKQIQREKAMRKFEECERVETLSLGDFRIN